MSKAFLFPSAFDFTLKLGLPFAFCLSLPLGFRAGSIRLNFGGGFCNDSGDEFRFGREARTLDLGDDNHDNDESADPECNQLRPAATVLWSQ